MFVVRILSQTGNISLASCEPSAVDCGAEKAAEISCVELDWRLVASYDYPGGALIHNHVMAMTSTPPHLLIGFFAAL